MCKLYTYIHTSKAAKHSNEHTFKIQFLSVSIHLFAFYAIDHKQLKLFVLLSKFILYFLLLLLLFC